MQKEEAHLLLRGILSNIKEKLKVEKKYLAKLYKGGSG